MPLQELDKVEIPLGSSYTVTMPAKRQAAGAPETARVLRKSARSNNSGNQNLLVGGVSG